MRSLLRDVCLFVLVSPSSLKRVPSGVSFRITDPSDGKNQTNSISCGDNSMNYLEDNFMDIHHVNGN